MEQIKAYEEMQASSKFEKWYRDMIKEHDGSELIMFDFGFVQYKIVNDQIIINEVYVAPEFRKREFNEKHPFWIMGDAVYAIGKELNVKYLTGRIGHDNKHKDRIMFCHLSYGMKLSNNEGQYIWTYKEIV